MTRFTLDNVREQYERMKAEKQEAEPEDLEASQYGYTELHDNHGVVISGGMHELHIHIGEDGVKVRKVKSEDCSNNDGVPSILPSILNTPKGLSVLSRYVNSGFLTEDFQPNHLSRAKAAIVAHSIATDLSIKNMWKVFGEFWNIKALASAYMIGINQANISTFLKEIEKV